MAIIGRARKDGRLFYVVLRIDGVQVWEKSGTDRREAVRLQNRRKDQIAAGTYQPPKVTSSSTVGTFAKRWGDARTNRNRLNDRAALRLHVLSRSWFASMRLDDVHPRHVIRLIKELQAGTLSPKSVANVYGTVRTMFRDARIEEIVTGDPCTIPAGLIDRTKTTRRMPYTAAEIAQFFAPSLPMDIRVFAAIAFFTGMREGEIAGLRWDSWIEDAQPLGALYVDGQYSGRSTKTGSQRRVPVHPELVKVLKLWRNEFYELHFAAKPTPSSPILPRKGGKHHTRSSLYKLWIKAYTAAGVENRSLHSTRHTFISLCRRGGAPKDIVEKITHNAKGDIVDEYTHFDWEPLCKGVLCIHVDAGVDGTHSVLANVPKEPGFDSRRLHCNNRESSENDVEAPGTEAQRNVGKTSVSRVGLPRVNKRGPSTSRVVARRVLLAADAVTRGDEAETLRHLERAASKLTSGRRGGR
jgi:integrase